MVVPAGFRFQRVSAAEVAGRLAGWPAATAGRAPDMGGPRVRGIRDLAASYLHASGRRGRCCRFRCPGVRSRLPPRRQPCPGRGDRNRHVRGVPRRAVRAGEAALRGDAVTARGALLRAGLALLAGIEASAVSPHAPDRPVARRRRVPDHRPQPAAVDRAGPAGPRHPPAVPAGTGPGYAGDQASLTSAPR